MSTYSLALRSLRNYWGSKYYLNVRFNQAPVRSYHKVHFNQSKSTRSENVIHDEPLQFFGSRAATWEAKDSRTGGNGGAPWYQPLVVVGSVAVFLIYFCIFREENDIDTKLTKSLFDHVEGLEVVNLITTYKYNRENGLPVKELEERLKELKVDLDNI